MGIYADPTPIGEEDTPPQAHPLGASGASMFAPSALDLCPHSEILDPPQD